MNDVTRPMKSIRLVATFMITATAVVLVPSAANAVCFPWKCCDEQGFDMDGSYLTRDNCESDGGIVECGTLVCSSDNVGPFKCCQADGDPFDGVYLSRHSCSEAGGTVFEDAATCPGFAFNPFRCCDPEGGDAPGVYAYRYKCEDDGYFVKERGLLCPNGFGEGWRCCDPKGGNAPFRMTRRGCEKDGFYVLEEGKCQGKRQKTKGQLGCTVSNRDYYLPIITTRARVYNQTHSDRWSDKDTHCAMTCLLQLHCGKAAAIFAGWANEAIDLVDKVRGNSFGSGDICANRHGSDVADVVDDSNLDETACYEMCNALPLEADCH